MRYGTLTKVRRTISRAACSHCRMWRLWRPSATQPWGRGNLKDGRIDALEPAAASENGAARVLEIFADVSGQPEAAAQKVLHFLNSAGDPKQLIDAARVLVFLKGTNAHDYKYSSATIEDYYHVSPAWRNRCLAGGVFLLRGSGAGNNKLVQRTCAALT